METFRRYFVVIVLTVVILIVWGGILLLSGKNFTTINPNAETYTKPLGSTFNKKILDTVSERTKSSFPVLPSVFFELESD